MPTKKTKSQTHRGFLGSITNEMLKLSTTGFGLVAALAWNEAVKTFIEEYVKPYTPGSGLVSQIIYAVIITLLAVTITYQLTVLKRKFTSKSSK